MTIDNAAVQQKTLELCHALVSEPDFVSLRRDLDTFLADEEAKQLYQTVAEKGRSLHEKQHQGVRLASDEISDYEQHREALLGNDVARRFLEAQEKMQQVQETVSRYVMKTLELGRVPQPDDFESCGHGCNCGH